MRFLVGVVAVITSFTLGGCATPQEREVAALEKEVTELKQQLTALTERLQVP